jgi:hypothetical protein
LRRTICAANSSAMKRLKGDRGISWQNPSDTLPLSEGRVGERWHVPLQELFRPCRPASLSVAVPAAATRPRHLSLTLSLDKERELKFILALRLDRDSNDDCLCAATDGRFSNAFKLERIVPDRFDCKNKCDQIARGRFCPRARAIRPRISPVGTAPRLPDSRLRMTRSPRGRFNSFM